MSILLVGLSSMGTIDLRKEESVNGGVDAQYLTLWKVGMTMVGDSTTNSFSG